MDQELHLSSKKRRDRIFRYAPLLIWIGVIFYLSSGQGSISETSRIIRPILEFLFPNAPEATLLTYHGYIRKFAHLAEYAVLGLLAALAFVTSSKIKIRNYWLLPALGLVLMTASLDEINQSFNTARTGSGWDVLLDMTGGITAILIVWVFARGRPESANNKAHLESN